MFYLCQVKESKEKQMAKTNLGWPKKVVFLKTTNGEISGCPQESHCSVGLNQNLADHNNPTHKNPLLILLFKYQCFQVSEVLISPPRIGEWGEALHAMLKILGIISQ